MIYKSRYFSLLLFVAILFGGQAQGQKVSKDKSLPNFFQINEILYRGGQPDDVGVRRLKDEFNIKTIIYLRSKGDKAERERRLAEDAGLRFINVPLHNWFAPKKSQIDKALAEITRRENQPVFVHCKRGADRTGTVVAVYRMTMDKWTPKQAVAEAKKFGIGWWQFWMKDYIHDYHRDYIAKK